MLALLASMAALGVSLARFRSLPQSPVHTALAAVSKTTLTHTFTDRDPVRAPRYYYALESGDYTTYTDPDSGVSFPYPKDFTVETMQADRGDLVLVTQPAVGMGFQIFITPDDETAPLTAARIHHDLPDLPMDEVTDFTLPDGTAAVRFVSQDPLLGDVGETWFWRDGQVYQLSVSAPDRDLQDQWIRQIAATLTFPDDGTANASTQQQ
jgi:hypothetical protein